MGEPRNHGRARRLANVVAPMGLAAAMVAPAIGLMRFTGPPMEEGFMLVFPELVLDGKTPNVDFLHLYGPGSLWMLAGIYRVLGATLTVERTVGLAQHAALVFGIYLLLRTWGRRVAVVGALVAMVQVMTPVGLTALAWDGAIALAVWSIAMVVGAVGAAERRRPVVAGVLAGLALLFRPDLIVALGLALLYLASRLDADERRRLVAATAVGVTPIVWLLADAGPLHAFTGMVVDPVLRLRGGRSLPTPPSPTEMASTLQRAAALRTNGWPFPRPEPALQVALWFWLLVLATGTIVAVIAWLWRRGDAPGTTRATAFGLLALGVLPQALQRPDTTHLAWVGCLTIPALIGLLAQWLRVREDAPLWVPGAIAVGIAAMLVVLAPQYTARAYVDSVQLGLGRVPRPGEVARGDRGYFYGDETRVADLQAAVDELDRRARPGERLIVGTDDLRFTPYSDAVVYWMFPELEPATYYIEMDPGIANAPDSGLAEELSTTDWLVQTAFWDGWDEPNESAVPGDPLPNEVVAERFCPVVERPTVTLSRRCR